MEKSRQYSFINNKNAFTISFINGGPLLNELALIHNIGPHAESFYKKTVLSSLQMVNFLKPGESLGFYIDSETPYYRYKIEIGQAGSFRTLLLPEDFEDFPTQLSGKCRIHKFMPNSEPYTSILSFNAHPLEELVNEVMDKSYQTLSKVIVSDHSSNALMITKLPPSNVNKKIEDFEELSLERIIEKYKGLIDEALCLNEDSIEPIIQFFEKNDLNYIGSKETKFHCPCSKERMIENLFTLNQYEREGLFEDRQTIETRCDYCNSIYTIDKNEIIGNLQ